MKEQGVRASLGFCSGSSLFSWRCSPCSPRSQSVALSYAVVCLAGQVTKSTEVSIPCQNRGAALFCALLLPSATKSELPQSSQPFVSASTFKPATFSISCNLDLGALLFPLATDTRETGTWWFLPPPPLSYMTKKPMMQTAKGVALNIKASLPLLHHKKWSSGDQVKKKI